MPPEDRDSTSPPNDSIEKRLNLMRFWLFGSFVLFFAGIVSYTSLYTLGNLLDAVIATVPLWLFIGVLCTITYYAYQWWLTRRH